MSERMSNRKFIVASLAITIGCTALFFGALWLGYTLRGNGPSDLVVGQAYQYHDFHSCLLGDGKTRAYDFHMGGRHRSLRAQFVLRVNNLGERTMVVVTNDPTLPKGHIRLAWKFVGGLNTEGHNFGTDWSGEYLQINPRRPIEVARNIPACGPAR